MPPISAACKLGKKEYLDFCRFRSWYLNRASRNLLWFPLLLLVFAAVNLALHNRIVAVVLLVLAALIPVWMLLNLNLYAAQDIKKYHLETPRVFYTLGFDAKGVHVENESEHADYAWGKVWRLCRTKRYVYVFLNPQRGFIVPASCLPESSADALWTLAEKHLPAEKRLSAKPFYEKE